MRRPRPRGAGYDVRQFQARDDADGIAALITWDAPGRPHVIDRNVIEELSIYGDVAGVVELCKWLESSCGVRFASKLLIDMAEKGDTFYGRFAGQRAAA